MDNSLLEKYGINAKIKSTKTKPKTSTTSSSLLEKYNIGTNLPNQSTKDSQSSSNTTTTSLLDKYGIGSGSSYTKSQDKTKTQNILPDSYMSYYTGQKQEQPTRDTTTEPKTLPKSYTDYFTSTPDERANIKREPKELTEIEIRKQEVQEEINELIPTFSLFGKEIPSLSVAQMSDEDKQKWAKLQYEYDELDRLSKPKRMGFAESFVPANIEKLKSREAERRGYEDLYKGEELQATQDYQTGQLIGKVAQFTTAYLTGGKAVEAGARTVASKLAPMVPYGAIGSGTTMNVIRSGLATGLASSFGVEMAKDVVLGSPLNLQEGLERGYRGKELVDFMGEQAVIDVALNSTILVGGKLVKGIKNAVLNKQQANVAFDLVESELKKKYGLSGDALDGVMNKVKKVIDKENVVNEAARTTKLQETINSIKASEDVVFGLETYMKKIKNIDTDAITFKAGKIADRFMPNETGVKLGGKTFNVVGKTDNVYKLVNNAGVEIQMPKDVVNSFGEITESIDINAGLRKTRTQMDSLKLKTDVVNEVFDTATKQAESTGVVPLSKETFEELNEQVVKNVDDSILTTKKMAATYKQNFKRESIKELKKTLGKVEEMLPEYKKAIKDITDDLDVKKLTSKKKLRLESLKKYINNAESELDYYKVPESLVEELDRIGKKSIVDLDYREVDEVLRVVKHIEHLEKTKKTLLTNIQEKTIKEAIDKTLEYGGGFKKKSQSKVLDLGEYIFRSGSLNLDRMTRMIGKWDATNPLHSIYKNLEEGYSTKMKQHVKDYSQFNDSLIKSLDLGAVGRQVNIENFSSPQLRQMYQEMTTMEKIELYLNTKSSYNYKNLVDKDGGIFHDKFTRRVVLTDNDVDLIVGSLTDNQKAYGDMLFDFNNKVAKNRLNQTSVMLDGMEIATIPNYHSVVSKSGTFNIGQGAGKKTIEGASILQERTNKVTAIRLMGADEHFKAYNEAVANYYGLAAPTRDLKAVLNNDNIQASLRERFGENVINTLDRKITDIEGGVFMEIDPLTGGMKKVTRNIQTAILGLNPKIVLNQLASIPTAMSELDAKYFFGKIGDRNVIEKYSPELWDRFRGMVTRESAEAIQRGSDWATVLIRKSDQKAIQTIWGATEREIAEKTGMTAARNGDEFYEAVARRVEEVVHRTQPNYNSLFTSGIGSTKDVAARLATMFTTQRNQNYQIMYEGLAEAISTGNIQKAGRSFGAVMSGALTYALINKGANMYRGYDTDDKGFIRDTSEIFAGSMISNVYFAGYLSNFFITGFETDNVLESTVNEFMYSLDNFTKDGDKKEAFKDLTLSISKMSGLPVENVEKEIRFAMKNFKPDMYYEYNKLFGKPTRTELYNNFESALKDGDTRFMQDIIKDMAEQGVQPNNVINSMKSRGINTDNNILLNRTLDRLKLLNR